MCQERTCGSRPLGIAHRGTRVRDRLAILGQSPPGFFVGEIAHLSCCHPLEPSQHIVDRVEFEFGERGCVGLS